MNYNPLDPISTDFGAPMLSKLLPSSSMLVGDKPLLQWQAIFLNHLQSMDAEFDPGHRIDHVMRVTKTALDIAKAENAEMAVVLPAAILHDTKPVGKFHPARSIASQLSADNSIKLLTEWNYPAEYYPAIHHAILTHSFSAGIHPESLEAKVVQDADRLDALGAIGIYRTIAVGSKNGNPLYNADEPFPIQRELDDTKNIIDHFYVKLFKLPETLHTDSAKQEAIKRIQVMETFLQGLASELGISVIPMHKCLSHYKSGL